MKTKITKHIAGAAFCGAVLLFASCNDFLDVQPQSSFSNEEIFASETETKAMMSTIYSKLCASQLYGFAWPYTFNTNTDVEMKSSSTQTSTSGNGDDISCFDPRPLWGSLASTWNTAYETINYCNDFLQNMEQSPLFSKDVADDTPTNAQQMYGEVKCLRAMVYLDLIRTWGDVVLRTTPTTAGSNVYSEGTTDRNEILAFLIDDLKGVEPMMKWAADMDEGVERASREYCDALIGQLALYRGGYSLMPDAASTIGVMKRPTDYADYYAIAKDYLGRVIASGRHSLDKESFLQMWKDESSLTVLKDGDVIFEIPMLEGSSSAYGYNIGVTVGYNADQPTHSFGQATNRVSLSGLYPFTFDPRDQRLYVTCVPYSYDADLNQTEKTVALGKTCVSGWNIGKWSKLYRSATPKGTAGNTGINAIRMRYADVLLMYAEVENEINGPTDVAKNALKEVRRRAFLPEDQAEMVDAYVNALGSKTDFFEALVNERAWEFGGEGIRKYDLARWNRYGSTIKKLYNDFIDWGQRAQGIGVKGNVRDDVFYRVVADSLHPGRTVLEFKGLWEYGDAIGEHPASEGWRYHTEYAKQWWVRNEESGNWEPNDDVKWSFRGFINYNNAATIGDNDVVRYLCPYPADVITAHRGSIKQQYGYE